MMNTAWRISGRTFFFLLLSLIGMSGTAVAADAQDAGDLRLVIVLSRHGVRSPTAEPGSLDAFSSKPWPTWTVQPGYLTPHGKQLMVMMGGWYRAYYAHAGLVPASGCMERASIDVTADDEQRTLESAHGLMDGFNPHCTMEIRSAPKQGPNALFSHGFTDVSDADRNEAVAAVLGRIGGDPQRLALAHAGLLTQMQAVLFGCQTNECTPAQAADKKKLLDQDSSVTAGHADGLVSIKSPLHNASTFAENFFLEYVEGMPMSDVAWGRISSLQLGQLLALHAAYSDINLRTPVIARAYAGHLATRILATLQQGAGQTAAAGGIGSSQEKIVFLVGHDTNIETLAGLLNLHWMLSEQPVDPTSTGGALVFELRQSKGAGGYRVRAYYVSQSMEQMRESAALSLEHPPEMAPIFIPGCSQATAGYDCPLDRFTQLVKQAVDASAIVKGAERQ